MSVQMSVFQRTHRSYGGAMHGSVITNLLQRAQPEFGPGLLDVYVELVCRAPSRIGTSIEANEVIMGTLVAKLPIGKMSPKAKRYALTVLSRRPGDEERPVLPIGASSFSLEDIQREVARQQAEEEARKAEFDRKRADVTALPRLFDEVADALAAMPPKLKTSAFDWIAFVQWFRSLKSELPTTLEDIIAAEAAARAAAEARLEAMDPWARLDINWRGFHQDARKLLPEPFFWSGDDDFAPHGNDEGFDVLAKMRDFPRKAAFTEDSLASLADHFGHTSEIMVADTDGFNQTRYLDFVVAVAFGHVKLKGFCPFWLRDRALAAMKREIAIIEALAERDNSGEPLTTLDIATAPNRGLQRDSLNKLIGALEQVPTHAST
ncbi:MAG: hypothetical protein R3D51_17650 [Hyphomicrobiaceae bacterium]